MRLNDKLEPLQRKLELISLFIEQTYNQHGINLKSIMNFVTKKIIYPNLLEGEHNDPIKTRNVLRKTEEHDDKDEVPG